jgi:hypothetical protein
MTTKRLNIVKTDVESDSSEYHYVYGVVYSPLEIDTDWESMTADDIRKMAHEFIASGQVYSIDVMHNECPSGAQVVESFIARKGDPDYNEGDWVLGVQMPDGELWNEIKSGNLNGFSVQMSVVKVPKKVLVDIAQIAIGDTELNNTDEVLPFHKHEYYIEFDSNGRVSLGMTDEEMGHLHQIISTVVTENELGHNHRFFIED